MRSHNIHARPNAQKKRNWKLLQCIFTVCIRKEKWKRCLQVYCFSVLQLSLSPALFVLFTPSGILSQFLKKCMSFPRSFTLHWVSLLLLCTFNVFLRPQQIVRFLCCYRRKLTILRELRWNQKEWTKTQWEARTPMSNFALLWPKTAGDEILTKSLRLNSHKLTSVTTHVWMTSLWRRSTTHYAFIWYASCLLWNSLTQMLISQSLTWNELIPIEMHPVRQTLGYLTALKA